MASIVPMTMTAKGTHIARYPALSPSDSALPPPTPPPPPHTRSSYDNHRRPSVVHAASATATTAPESRLSSTEEPLHSPRSTTASSPGEIVSTPNLVKKDRAKSARKDALSAVAKEVIKDPTNPREAFKDARDQRASANGRTASPVHPSSFVDPLSHHIFARTTTERSITSRLLNPTRPESPSNESSLPRPVPDIPNKHSTSQTDSIRDKKKGVSFLSRLSMIGGKKREEDIVDDESVLSEQRTEGADAVAFSSAVYIPHHKQPPRYIRVRSHNRKAKEFDRTFLAQKLKGTYPLPPVDQPTATDANGDSRSGGKDDSSSGGPIWAVEFSQDGQFFATGGRDRVLRVWAVIATEEDRKVYNEEESAKTDEEERLRAPVFHSKPAREFIGHEGDILDLSWSKNNFLLSSSMDKTVRLWHMSRRECLCTFKHKDLVASIAFHPRDDRFFLAGSLDSSLRLWSIPDKAVAYSSQLTDIITAVGFSPDGKTAIAGSLHGLCTFYETEGLKLLSQLHVRSSRGKNAKGSKITGIQTISIPPDDAGGDVKLLITSNDSRIRIYNMTDKTLEAKLKGHENACNQIRASFSDDGAYVICGSEDKKAFIWSRGTADLESRGKCPGECFEAHSDVVTTAIFAPTKTRQLLQASQDPIFTLCNPPPVTLRSREESTANLASSTYDTQSEYSVKASKAEQTPAFISRSAHPDGNIIVTTDNSGLIKVFRQDCAYIKRRHDNWETGSSISKKLAKDRLILGRPGSIMTGTSVSSRDPHSRRASLSQQPQISSDRINTWRHGVEGNPGRPLSMTLAITATTTPTGSVRSPSPNKIIHTPVSPTLSRSRSDAQRHLNSATSPISYPTSPTTSLRSARTGEAPRKEAEVTVPPTPNFSIRSIDDTSDDDDRLDFAGAANSFWNLNKWRQRRSASGSSLQPHTADQMTRENDPPVAATTTDHNRHHHHHHQRSSIAGGRLLPSPLEEENDENDDENGNESTAGGAGGGGGGGFLAPPVRVFTNGTGSILSRLSSELTASASDDGEEMQCVKCGNKDFRAKRVGGMQRLLCGKCGRMVDI